jgi:beta-lactamase class C
MKKEMPLISIARAVGPLVLSLVSFFLLATAGRAADNPPKITAAVDGAFKPLLQQHDVPGIAVAVTVDGKQYFFSYGVVSKDSNAPVTKDTLFEIGSISKTFTATLAAYGQALGKLSLDDHPGKYMPQLRGSATDKASLLNLATFTAGGLPLQFPAAVTSDAAMVTFFKQWKPAAAPGAQRRYSNPSIGLFGRLTATAMNGKFADLMEAELLPKLGLKHSYIRVPKAEMERYAWGIRDGKPTRATPGVFDQEAYGIKSSAADMIRYVEANIRPDALEPPLKRAVEATHVGYFRTGEMVQGLGWEQYPYPTTLKQLLAGNSEEIVMKPNPTAQLAPPLVASQPTLFNKTGSTNGFGAYAVFVPAKKIGLVMLANRNFPVPARLAAAHAVLEQLAAGAK